LKQELCQQVHRPSRSQIAPIFHRDLASVWFLRRSRQATQAQGPLGVRSRIAGSPCGNQNSALNPLPEVRRSTLRKDQGAFVHPATAGVSSGSRKRNPSTSTRHLVPQSTGPS